jgi:hypothetical protein
MSKYVLTGDMPKSCSNCDICSPIRGNNHCNFIGHKVTDFRTSRHPQCPLQDTTELLEALEA